MLNMMSYYAAKKAVRYYSFVKSNDLEQTHNGMYL
jgi:hypothetical protein